MNRGFGRQEKMASKTSAHQMTSALHERNLNVPSEDIGARSKISEVKGQYRREVQQVVEKPLDNQATQEDTKNTVKQDVLPKSLAVPMDVDVQVESTDAALEAVYERDIHTYLKAIEHKCCSRPTFLDNGDITASNRKVLVAWMREVQEFLQIRQETFHLALTITDLVVQSSSVKLREYQLLGLVGFFIATKYLERYVAQIDTLMYLASYAYDSRAILTKEKEVLRILDYDLNLPTPSWFLEYYTRDDDSVKIHQLAALLLDLFALDPESTTDNPLSIRAASALMTANQLLARPEEFWQQDLELKSGYSAARLESVNRRLQGLISGLKAKQRCSLEQTIVDMLSSRTTTSV